VGDEWKEESIFMKEVTHCSFKSTHGLNRNVETISTKVKEVIGTGN